VVKHLTEQQQKREPKPEKKVAVKEFLDRVQASKSAVVTGYSGMTVEEVTDLRAQLYHAKVEYHVVKNNLARLALNQANITVLDDLLVGPTAIALAMEDAVAPARILSKFSKGHEKLVLRGGWLEGRKISVQDIKALANLPSREVLLAKMLGSMMSPVSGFVRVLAGPANKLVYALNAIKEAKAKTA
jgi:large subunit ribosomal protein L10